MSAHAPHEQGKPWRCIGLSFVVSSHGVFFVSFLWALLAGSLLQWLVLPALPGLHAGDGLLKGGDWIWFHSEAVKLASLMNQDGWQVWELRPQGNAPIGISAGIYFLLGISKPWVVLPINAAVFAVAAVSLYAIFKSLAARRLAFFATLPFVFFPSAAMIYGQLHKDVFSIAGTLLITYVWVQFAQWAAPSWRKVFGLVLLAAVGCFLVWIVRSYLLQVLMLASLLTVFILAGMTSQRHGTTWWCGVLLCVLMQIGFSQIKTISLEANAPATSTSTSTSTAMPAESSFLARAVATLNAGRAGFATGAPLAGSNVDIEVRFGSLADIVMYVPRAFQLGLLAPFPSMWTSEGVTPGAGAMRVLSGLEMAVSYMLLVGVGFLLYFLKVNRPVFVVAVLISLVLLLVLALVVCNVGTLYRMRYGSWQLLNGLGVLGWGLMFQARHKSFKL